VSADPLHRAIAGYGNNIREFSVFEKVKA